jgi:hypothetical protein
MTAQPVSCCGEVYWGDAMNKSELSAQSELIKIVVHGDLRGFHVFTMSDYDVLYDWAPPTSVVDKMDGFDE